MTVTCPSCQASLTIPDDRIPRGKIVSAVCPRCKGPLTIDATGSPGAPEPSAPGPGPAPAAGQMAAGEPTQTAEERRQPQALVCIPAGPERSPVLAALRELGFAVQVAEGAEQALEKLRFTPFAVAVLRDGFGGGENSVVTYVAEMAMARRRSMVTVLVSPGAASHDFAAAFSRSVDLLLDPGDLPQIARDLKRTLAEKEQIYRAYREVQEALNRA